MIWESAAILQLFAHKCRTLLVGWDALLSWILILTLSVVSRDSTMRVVVSPGRVFTKICVSASAGEAACHLVEGKEQKFLNFSFVACALDVISEEPNAYFKVTNIYT